MSRHIIDTAMIGPSGAGKTSLLASMYSQFTDKIPGAELRRLTLSPDDETRVWLGHQRAELVSIGRQIMVTEPGIAGSADARTLSLSLLRTDRDNHQHLKMRFTDYPGSWLFPPKKTGPPSKDKDYLELRSRMERSNSLIVAIDTPALMFDRGKYHDEFNRPQEVADLVGEWAGQSGRDLLLLVPIKSEKWVRDDKDRRELVQRIRQGYSRLINKTAGDRISYKRITPVQTVGSLDHSYFEVTNAGAVVSHFRAHSTRPEYSPEWVVEPLRQLLLATIKTRLDRRGFWEKFGSLFGHQHDLRRAVEDLARTDLGPNYQLSE